jgi:hypothetical protein
MLTHSGPLGLVHCLLNVEQLPFGCVSSKDCELMQLKTVSESSLGMQMPSCSYLTIHSSPQITLVHLATNLIQAGLQITGQEVS